MRTCSLASRGATATRSGISTSRYARAVLGLALRRLGDRGRAEDAVQEAFASIWRSARSYRRERGPVAPWLYTVARNAIADRGRARIELPVEPPDTPSDAAGPGRAGRAVLGRPGACTARSRSCPRPSAACSSWRTGAGSRRARSRTSSASRSAPSRRGRGAGSARLAEELEGGARVTTPPDFFDLVGDEGTPEELERLRRAHDLLVAAGPPPELSPASSDAPQVGETRAAASSAAAGRRRSWRSLRCWRSRRSSSAMRSRTSARASRPRGRFRCTASARLAAAHADLAIGSRDVGGNYPLKMTVRGLPRLQKDGWYELLLSKGGRPTLSCGSFRVDGRSLTCACRSPTTWAASRSCSTAGSSPDICRSRRPGRRRDDDLGR